jgi:hypothetical protein
VETLPIAAITAKIKVEVSVLSSAPPIGSFLFPSICSITNLFMSLTLVEELSVFAVDELLPHEYAFATFDVVVIGCALLIS